MGRVRRDKFEKAKKGNSRIKLGKLGKAMEE